MSVEINSPFTSRPAVKIKQFSCNQLVEKYQVNFNIDVTYLLGKHEFIDLYQCEESGYKFYYPYDVAGDGKFYEHFQQFDWYYLPWKWEHKTALNYVKPGMNVLEVGCAKGAFLERVTREKGADTTGLELNEEAVRIARLNGLNVLHETIETHCKTRNEYYDLVTSFQVLEHISDVHSFLKSQVEALRVGGTLLICVPNNDSFIKYYDGGILNFPPHHMGLWNKESLTNLTKYLSLELIEVRSEPLQSYHIPWYVKYIMDNYLVSPRLKSIGRRLYLHKLLEYVVGLFATNIKGHSIFVAYKKI